MVIKSSKYPPRGGLGFAIICASISAFLFVIPGTKAYSQQAAVMTVPCRETKALLAEIQNEYHEEILGGGLTKNDDLIRVFVSDKNTFTVLRTTSNGLSCMIATGTDWIREKPAVMGTKL